MELVWITGANGLIDNQLLRTAPHANVRGLTRQDLDLTDYEKLGRMFREQKPGLVIHCAALSKSQDCQANPPLARTLNVEVTAQLAELAADIPFVFFSTDLVFDGQA